MYLGLDNALSTTGWCILKDEKTLVAYGSWTTKANQKIEQRLGQIWQELNLLYNKYNFCHIFFEDCYKQPNMQTYQKLSMVKATILLWSFFNDVSCSCCEPSHWRSVLKTAYNGFGFGRARTEQKQKAIEFCKTFLDIDVTSDEADAICLGKAGLIEKQSKRSAF